MLDGSYNDKGISIEINTPISSFRIPNSVRMFIDHKEALGFRTVKRVIVLRQEEAPEGTIPSLTFMILLSSKRGIGSDDKALEI